MLLKVDVLSLRQHFVSSYSEGGDDDENTNHTELQANLLSSMNREEFKQK